jgi:hypothetical protein
MATERLARKIIRVRLKNTIRMFEIGLEEAHWKVINEFGIDDSGHAEIEGYMRGSCSIHIKFLELEAVGGMDGWSYNMIFEATCEKYIEDEDT